VTRVSLLIIAFLFVGTSHAQTAGSFERSSASRTLFPAGEILNFRIAWGFIEAGEAQMVAARMADGSRQLRAYAWNNGLFESLYRVSDTIVSTLDPQQFQPLHFSKILNEGGWHSRSLIEFDQKRGRANLADTVLDGKGLPKPGRSTDTTVALDGLSFDILSAFYYFRTLPLQVGKSHELLAVSGKKKYRLKVLVHRKERIDLDSGSYDCIVIEPILADDELFKAKGKLTIWLTDDQQRIPVLVKAKIALGSIRVELKERIFRAGA